MSDETGYVAYSVEDEEEIVYIPPSKNVGESVHDINDNFDKLNKRLPLGDDILNQAKEYADTIAAEKLDKSTKYAGSDVAGGAANSAKKLLTDAGDASNPVYFKNGVPVKCGHSVKKDVPEDAVFTDTKDTAGVTRFPSSQQKLYLIGCPTDLLGDTLSYGSTYTYADSYILNGNLYINGKKIAYDDDINTLASENEEQDKRLTALENKPDSDTKDTAGITRFSSSLTKLYLVGCATDVFGDALGDTIFSGTTHTYENTYIYNNNLYINGKKVAYAADAYVHPTYNATDVGEHINGTKQLVPGTPFTLPSFHVDETGHVDSVWYNYYNIALTIDSALSDTSKNAVQNKTVKAELDKKLPLSGGTMDNDVKIKIPHSTDGRIGILTSSGYRYKIPSNTGFAMAECWYTDEDLSNNLGGIGAYGTNNDISYFFVGGTYNNPLFKVNKSDGSGVFKGSVTAAEFVGNASSASKFETARKITLGTGLQGSVSFDGSANVTLSGSLKRCYTCDESSDYATYPWRKIADAAITGTYSNINITFLVTCGWSSNTVGILRAHIRVGGKKGVYETGYLNWGLLTSSTSYINPSNFVMVYTNNSGTSLKAEIWVKNTARYNGYMFTVLDEGYRTHFANVWNIYTNPTRAASYTSGTGTIVSSLETILNNASSASKLTTSAGSAAQPVYFKDGKPVACGFKINNQSLLYSMSEIVSSPLTVNITGLFTAYTVVVCNVVTSDGRHSLTLPLQYIKSLGTSAYYEAESILFHYVDDNNIKISTGMGQINPTIISVKIINLL